MTFLEDYYSQNKTRVVKALTRTLNGDWASAEDIVQDAAHNACKYANTFEGSREDWKAWFNTILYGALSNWYRTKSGMTKEPLDNHQNLKEPSKQAFLDNVDLVLNELEEVKNERVRKALYLYLLVGYTSKEAGEATGYSESHVRKQVGLFRKQIHAQWGVKL